MTELIHSFFNMDTNSVERSLSVRRYHLYPGMKAYVASRKLNLGDGESVLSLLYEAYGDINPMYDEQIKADFAALYQALNGTPLQEMDWIINPVCALCRDHERNGFFHGVQVGIRLAKEVQSTE